MKCPPHSPVEVHLAILALAALAKGHLARVLAVQMAAVSHAATDVATVVAVAVTVVTALRLEVAACSVGLVRVRVPVRTAVDHVGRMLTVDQIRAGRMMVDQVGAPVAALLAAVGRAGLVFVVVVQRDLVPHDQVRHDQVRHDQVRRDQVRQGLGTRGGIILYSSLGSSGIEADKAVLQFPRSFLTCGLDRAIICAASKPAFFAP